VSSFGSVAGSYITDGEMKRGACRCCNKQVIHESEVASPAI
jgi:hypothetical protein